MVLIPVAGLSGSENVANLIVLAIVAVLCVYWLRALRLAREGVRDFVRKLVIAVALFASVVVLLDSSRLRTQIQPAQELFAAALVSFLFISTSKRRTRHIPRSVRAAVIARDLKGRKFNSKKHHVDHVWPFSRGGSHTADNLRVIEKRKNLSKGAKRPRMRDMW